MVNWEWLTVNFVKANGSQQMFADLNPILRLPFSNYH